MAVSNIDENGNIARSSSRGADIEIAAPGTRIASTYARNDADYVYLSGTSMAAPHVSGVAALMLSANSALSGAQLRQLLKASAVDTGLAASEEGAGSLDAAAAVAAATGSEPPSNSPPTASFTFSCSGLACDFDGRASADSDGSISSYSWDFGDGATASGATTSHSYAAAGTYTVTLTVTDDDGATATDAQSVTVSGGDPGGDPISLDANGYKVKGRHHVDLAWSGATSAQIDVYRDGAVIATTADDGAYTDATGNRGGASYTYRVCEAGTSTCSNTVTVVF
jgi:PKD repeat protein